MFMQIEGIEGESTDDAHKGWIEILSFNHGVSQAASGATSATGGGSTQRADFQDFSIVKVLDKSTPLLNKNCAFGATLKTVKIHLCKATGEGQAVYMEYTMTDAIISSVSIGGGGGGEPTESLTFNYGKFDWNYIHLDRRGKKAGNVPAGWDLQANKMK